MATYIDALNGDHTDGSEQNPFNPYPQLKDIKKLSEFMEILEWQFDGHGLVITDWHDLTEAVLNTFPELEDDLIEKENE